MATTPRGRLLEVLLAGAAEAAAAGDLQAARIAHRAAGELLGAEAAESAVVVDLSERRRDGGGRSG